MSGHKKWMYFSSRFVYHYQAWRSEVLHNNESYGMGSFGSDDSPLGA